ncbi:tetratricopeptide repeat protein [Nocardia niwae]|uniref:Tetratricopeptide repeat protein n=1 Tax=Nocardia niwae TaxID=626084 RepID=A0ABV2X3D6_9NOCA
MNERYSSWAARNTPEELPLAARYQSADPILWHGSMVYPMYTEQVGPAPTTIALTMISAAPPAGLRGLGMGLSVVDGYLDLHGRSLAGVDAWSDALAAGVSFAVTPTAPVTLVTLTPVWVDEFGTQKSWAGNYGIVVEHQPNGRVVLWCSIGEGPPNFANLVVELSTAPTPLPPGASALAATTMTPVGMSAPALDSSASAGPPTAPTMPVPRIDAGPPTAESAAPAQRLAAEPSTATDAVNGQASRSPQPRRAGSLFVNVQSSRAARSSADTPSPVAGARAPDNPPAAPSRLAAPPATDAAHSVPDPFGAGTPLETERVAQPPGAHIPSAQDEVPSRGSEPYPLAANERSTADSYGTFGPPVAHTHPPEDPAHSFAGLSIGNAPPAPAVPPPPRPSPNGQRTESDPLSANPWTAADAYRAFDPTGTHPQHPALPSTPHAEPGPAAPQPLQGATPSPAQRPGTDSGPLITDSWAAGDSYPAFGTTGAHQQPPADTPPPDARVAQKEPELASAASILGERVSPTPAADVPVREPGPAVANTRPPVTTPMTPPSIDVSTAPAPDVLPLSAPRSATIDAPRTRESRESGDPGYRGALYDLGVAMYRRGEEEQACGLWAQASEAGHAGAAYELGMVRLRRGDPVGAESWWRTAADRREPRAITELADLLDQLGKHAEAKSWRIFAAELQDPDVVGQPTSR